MEKNFEKPKFCSRCHRQVIIPEIAKKISVAGNIKINCWNCKEGQIIITTKNLTKVK